MPDAEDQLSEDGKQRDGKASMPPLGKENGHMEYSERHHSAALVIGTTIRGYLTRREFSQAKKNNKIHFKRRELYERLRDMPNTRVSWCYFIFFVFLTLTFLLFTLSSYNTMDRWDTTGFVAEYVRTNQWQNAGTLNDVGSPGDFYTMLDGIIDLLVIGNGQSDITTLGNHMVIMSAPFIGISQTRGYNTSCSNYYTQGNVVYNDGSCLQTISEGGLNADTFGNTTGTEFNQISTLSLTGGDVSAWTSGSICPSFEFSDTSYYFEGQSHNAQLWHRSNGGDMSTTTQLKELTAILNRCHYLDPFTREVAVELMTISGNRYSVGGTLFITYKIGIWGEWQGTYYVSMLRMDSDFLDSETIDAIAMLVLAVSCWNVIYLAIYAIFNFVANGQFRGLKRFLVDVDTWLSLSQNVLYIACISLWWRSREQSRSTADTLSRSSVTASEVGATLRLARDSDEAFFVANSLSILVVVFRIISFFRHRGFFALLIRVLQVTAINLVHFVLVFGVVLFGFASAGTAAFGHRFYEFRTPYWASVTMGRWLFGEWELDTLFHYQSIYGPVFFFSYMLISGTLLMNFTISIIMDGYGAIGTARRISTPVYTEIWIALHFTLETMKDYLLCGCGRGDDRVITAASLAWMLYNGPFFTGKTLTPSQYVSLHEIKRLEIYRYAQEVHVAIEGLAADSGMSEEDVYQVSNSRYRHATIDRWEECFTPKEYKKVTKIMALLPPFYRRYWLQLAHIISNCVKRGKSRNIKRKKDQGRSVETPKQMVEKPPKPSQVMDISNVALKNADSEYKKIDESEDEHGVAVTSSSDENGSTSTLKSAGGRGLVITEQFAEISREDSPENGYIEPDATDIKVPPPDMHISGGGPQLGGTPPPDLPTTTGGETPPANLPTTTGGETPPAQDMQS